MEKAYFRETRTKFGAEDRTVRKSNEKKDAQTANEREPPSAEKLVKRHKRKKRLLRVMLFLIGLLLLAVMLNSAFAGPAAAAAEKETERIAADIINSAVLETMEEYEKNGGTANFTSESVNEDGTGFLYVDSAKLNLMSALIADRIQARLESLEASGVALPVGTVSGIAALNGLGPKLTAQVHPIGSIKRSFSSSFTAAGVNQTKYSAVLRLRLELLVLFGGRQMTVTVECSTPLVETLIIGSVPHAYTDVASLNDALNLIPTDAD